MPRSSPGFRGPLLTAVLFLFLTILFNHPPALVRQVVAAAVPATPLPSPNGIYCIGGHLNEPLSSAEYFDPEISFWVYVASMSTKRYDAAAVFVGITGSGGNIFVFGGLTSLYGGSAGNFTVTGNATASVEMYSPTTNTWSFRGQLSRARFAASAVVLDSLVYIIGGADGDTGTSLDIVERYSPNSSSFNTRTNSATILRAAMNTPRANCAAVSFGGSIFVFGGYNHKDGYLDSVERYLPSEDTWEMLPWAKMPHPMAGMRALQVQELVLMVGGNLDAQWFSPYVYVFDPVDHTWTQRHNALIVPRAFFGLAEVEDGIYALGGVDFINTDNNFVESTSALNSSTDTWHYRYSMRTQRSFFTAVTGPTPQVL